MTTMHGKRILVVEDEYLLADDMRATLEDAGAEVLGPAADIADALALIEREERIDGALLDINLSGTPAYPVADALTGRAVPFAFATGFDENVLPARFAGTACLEKPIGARKVLAVLAQLVA